jgi:3-phenylpropionate/trans-cinnamate dioxygenase ferredoxin reductase component
MTDTVIIAGAGQCGATTAFRLRSDGFEGRIVLIGAEPSLPYQRPPLSKAFLAGEVPEEKLHVRPEAQYERQGIELVRGTTITRIEPEAQRVELDDRRTLDYDHLILATGARVRRLDEVEGARSVPLQYLRTLADSRSLSPRLDPATRLAIVGAGYIGLEVAATARKLGCDVTVLEAEDRILRRVAGIESATWIEQVHAGHGVDLLTGARIEAFENAGDTIVVHCADGTGIEADIVLVGIGVVPNSGLAEQAGLEVDDGIVVDEQCRTSDPRILAAGDCTRHPSHHYGGRVRLESVQNATGQARIAAATVCGKDMAYRDLPWFWSDQYDIKLQIAGLSAGHDRALLRGRPEDGRFSVLYYRNDRLIAADSFNQMQEHAALRALIGNGTDVLPETLADPATSLQDLAAQAKESGG